MARQHLSSRMAGPSFRCAAAAPRLYYVRLKIKFPYMANRAWITKADGSLKLKGEKGHKVSAMTSKLY